jgi:23S rRNA pseudouridine955/2504/2580 synthase/23S rRNA pseudouridine1911/1915/1917 synthase
VLPEGASEELGALVGRLGTAADGALVAGRVFVDGRRTTEPHTVVAAGSAVEVHAGRELALGVEILAEHRGLVFASKPAGMATEPDHAGIEGSLVAQVATLLGTARTGLHALSRLDVGVSGVVTLARDAEARRFVTELREKGRFGRRYIALAPRAPEPSAGEWAQPVEGRDACTRYAVVARGKPAYLPSRSAKRDAVEPALLALSPVTGRTHQLRVHAAQAGAPLLGDTAHGGPTRLLLPSGSVCGLERVSLHAAWVELDNAGERLRVAAPLPSDLVELWQTLGGAPDDWARALEIALEPAKG